MGRVRATLLLEVLDLQHSQEVSSALVSAGYDRVLPEEPPGQQHFSPNSWLHGDGENTGKAVLRLHKFRYRRRAMPPVLTQQLLRQKALYFTGLLLFRRGWTFYPRLGVRLPRTRRWWSLNFNRHFILLD